MTRSILVVDDDPHIRELLVFALNKAGYRTAEASDGEAALERVAGHPPDLIVLDINMPRLDGLEVCRRLRAAGDVPILFLSSRDEEVDRVVGIEIGADDYVVKPFSPREVVARVGAILKRGRASTKPRLVPTQLQRGKLELDEDGWCARWDGSDAALTASEFRLLVALMRAGGRFLTRDMIIDQVHGAGFAVTDRTIDSHVRNVRAKIAVLGGTDVIETRSGVGYRIGRCTGAA